jgi:ribosomal protein L37AE/L43A
MASADMVDGVIRAIAFYFKLTLGELKAAYSISGSHGNHATAKEAQYDMAENLGTKRQCPKCAAKFYDFGATGEITCPKCGKKWSDSGKKPRKAKAVKPAPVAKKPAVKKMLIDPDALPDGLPEVEESGEIELEPIEDDSVEVISLDEVEEHEEKAENDPDSDDAEDEMFTGMPGETKLVDDLEDHIETDEDEEDDESDEEE